MLQIQNILKYYGGVRVLEEVNFQLLPGEKIGLMGVNGSGKTTLLRIIAGMLEPDAGRVIFPGDLPIGFLRQEVDVEPENTLREEMRRALPNIIETEQQLRQLEDELESCTNDMERMEAILSEYTALQEQFHLMDGGDLDWKIDVIIQGLGFSLEDRNRKVAEFSGGWQMRIQLAKLLIEERELLLLDEPTNHLDMSAIEWLEEYLADYPGAVIIVSHDRYFLNRVVTRTLFLDRGKVRSFPGNYDMFIEKLQHERELQEQAYRTQQKKLEKDRRFIERFRYKATLASRVKAREKMLDRMDLVECPEKQARTVSFSFEEEKKDMTVVFHAKDLRKEYPGQTVELAGEMDFMGEDRVALIGPNGCGKTTLLRILAGLDGRFKGRLTTHPNARIAYYLQNQAEQLDESYTVLEELREAAPRDISTEALRTILGSFLFRGDDVFKKVSVLSGGQKSKLALAMMVCSPANVLLMDEPTNHLDFESREVLAGALNSFEGTVIVISHDRYFIEQVCNRIIEIEEGKLVSYPGNYSYYRRKKESYSTGVNWISPTAAEPTTARGIRRAKQKARKQKQEQKKQEQNTTDEPAVSPWKIRDDLARLEETITKLEKELAEVETSLAEPENMGNEEKLRELIETYTGVKESLDTSMLRWEELSMQAEETGT